MSGFTVSMDGLRKNMARDANDFKVSFLELLAREDISKEDAEDVIQELNSLICSVNSIQCVSVEGIDDFSDLTNEVYVKLIDIDEG
jgi:Asp-tRNA(Asn)/Glu-tRNA(Gln) amidotransferase C subunit